MVLMNKWKRLVVPSACLKNIMELYALHVLRSDVDLFGPHDTSEYTIRMRNEAEKYLDKVRLAAHEKICK